MKISKILKKEDYKMILLQVVIYDFGEKYYKECVIIPTKMNNKVVVIQEIGSPFVATIPYLDKDWNVVDYKPLSLSNGDLIDDCFNTTDWEGTK